jgi:hypothetical protein
MAGPLVLLWLGSASLVYALLGTEVLRGNQGLMNITETYGALERVGLWQRALQWLPGAAGDGRFFTLPPPAIAWMFRFGVVAMCVGQAWSVLLAWRRPGIPFWRWLVGPVGAHLILLLMAPSNADVFYYEISGDFVNGGINPYIRPPIEFPDHPLYPYNHWVNMTAVYGPLWTTFSAGVMRITGPDPVMATVAFKVLLGIAAFGCALFTFWLARRLTGNTGLATAAGVLVAWQPSLLIESSGQAHNDPVMMLLANGGLALLLFGGTGALRGALVLVTASSMIKYVTLPLAGILALTRVSTLRSPGGPRRLVVGWALDAVAIIAVAIACFLPYWEGPDTVTEMFREPGRLFSHPLWLIPVLLLEWFVSPGFAGGFEVALRVALPVVLLAILGRTACRLVQTLRGAGDEAELSRPWTRAILLAWTIMTAALAFVPANSHSWYWTWPVVPVALLIAWDASAAPAGNERPAPPRWLWAYLAVTMVMTLIYHTRIVNP